MAPPTPDPKLLPRRCPPPLRILGDGAEDVPHLGTSPAAPASASLPVVLMVLILASRANRRIRRALEPGGSTGGPLGRELSGPLVELHLFLCFKLLLPPADARLECRVDSSPSSSEKSSDHSISDGMEFLPPLPPPSSSSRLVLDAYRMAFTSSAARSLASSADSGDSGERSHWSPDHDLDLGRDLRLVATGMWSSAAASRPVMSLGR